MARERGLSQSEMVVYGHRLFDHHQCGPVASADTLLSVLCCVVLGCFACSLVFENIDLLFFTTSRLRVRNWEREEDRKKERKREREREQGSERQRNRERERETEGLRERNHK